MVKRPYIYLAFSLLLIIGFFAFWFGSNQWRPAWADSLDPGDTPLRGWAWTETIGWISFNNCNIDGYRMRCNEDENGNDKGYLVSVGPDDKLKGHAWSENVGWIDFGDSPDSANCHRRSECPDINGCSAKYVNGALTGWARVCALDDGSSTYGWIHLDGRVADNSAYKVLVTGPNSTNDNPDWGDLTGWAWDGDKSINPEDKGRGIGWISFKGNISNGSQYGVTAQPVAIGIKSISPTTGTESTDVTLSWGPKSGAIGPIYGATNYEIHQASATCSNNVGQTCNVVACAKTIRDASCICDETATCNISNTFTPLVDDLSQNQTSFDVIGLKSFSTYRFKILAKNRLGGVWSETLNYSPSPLAQSAYFDISGACNRADSQIIIDLKWQRAFDARQQPPPYKTKNYQFSFCVHNVGDQPGPGHVCWSSPTKIDPQNELKEDGEYWKFKHTITDSDDINKLKSGSAISYTIQAVGDDQVCQGGPNDDQVCTKDDCSYGGGYCMGAVCVEGTNAGKVCNTAVSCSVWKENEGVITGTCGPSLGTLQISLPLQVCPYDSNYKEVKPQN